MTRTEIMASGIKAGDFAVFCGGGFANEEICHVHGQVPGFPGLWTCLFKSTTQEEEIADQDLRIYTQADITNLSMYCHICRVDSSAWLTMNSIRTSNNIVVGANAPLFKVGDFIKHFVTNLVGHVHTANSNQTYGVSYDGGKTLESTDERNMFLATDHDMVRTCCNTNSHEWVANGMRTIPCNPGCSSCAGPCTKVRVKIPENENRLTCFKCGRKTKQVILFRSTSNYCPDCE